MNDTDPNALSRRSFVAGGTVALGGFAAFRPTFAEAAPKSKLLNAKWTTTGSGGDPDAAPWGAFLSKWLRAGPDGVMRVDYGGAKAAGAKAPLVEWLDAYQAVDPTTLSPMAAQAYWINIYNAVTIDLVLGDYPVKSITRISGGLFNTGPWDEKVVTINGDQLSLNDIEHGILRPIWKDPRVHYGVNCASIGCPDLSATPWRAGDLDERMAAAARTYVNHPRGARVESGRLIVSKIYTWFQEDFGGDDAGVIAHLKRYADEPLAGALEGVSSIADSEYDWALNDV